MGFSVQILGSSSAKPTADRHHSSQIVNISEQYFLVDAGEGCQRQMFRLGVNPLKIAHVFLSHLHGDHVYGLFPLLSTMSLYGRTRPLTIYAPEPFGEMLEWHTRLFDRGINFPIEWVRVDGYKRSLLMKNKTVEVWSVPLKHRSECSGYLFKESDPALNIEKYKIEKYSLSIAQIAAAKRGEEITLESGEVIANEELTYLPYRGRSYAYLSDTSFSRRAADMCRGVDLLYHEATYTAEFATQAKDRGHSTAAEAAEAAIVADAKRLIIGHFSTRYKDLNPLLEEAQAIFPNTELAIEGHKFEIPKQR